MSRLQTLRLTLSTVAILLLCVGAAHADQAADRDSISAKLNEADSAWSKEDAICQKLSPPIHPPCGDHNSPLHTQRVSDYGEAEKLIKAYLDRWSGNPNWASDPPSGSLSAKLVTLLFTLAVSADRAEHPANAARYYHMAALRSANDSSMTVSINGSTVRISAASQNGLKDLCKGVGYPQCNVTSKGDVNPGPAAHYVLIFNGHPTDPDDLAVNALKPADAVQAPILWNHITGGQEFLMQNVIQNMAVGGH